MRVLVTGGTGFVGGSILNELHRAGHGILLLARSTTSSKARETARRLNAELRPGNVLQPESLPSACQGADAVIHLVGIISEVGEQTFENVHTEGTRNIVAAAQQAGVKRYVQMSALGTRPNAVARYHKSKWAGEEIVRGSGLDWTIFRPSIIYGPGDGFVNLFAKIIRRSPVVPILGSGKSQMQPVRVENVAKAFVGALNEPKAIGQTFDLAGPERFTLEQIVDIILSVMRRKRLKLHVPMPVVRMQALFLELLFGMLHKPPPLHRDQLIMLQEDNVGNPDPANELFGLSSTAFRDGIAGYLKA